MTQCCKRLRNGASSPNYHRYLQITCFYVDSQRKKKEAQKNQQNFNAIVSLYKQNTQQKYMITNFLGKRQCC